MTVAPRRCHRRATLSGVPLPTGRGSNWPLASRIAKGQFDVLLPGIIQLTWFSAPDGELPQDERLCYCHTTDLRDFAPLVAPETEFCPSLP